MAGHIDLTGPDNAIRDLQSQVPREAFEASPPPVAEPLKEISEVSQSLYEQGLTFTKSMFRTWSLYQLCIALTLFVVSYGLKRIFAPRLHEWLRTRDGWPKWRLRTALIVQNGFAGYFS